MPTTTTFSPKALLLIGAGVWVSSVAAAFWAGRVTLASSSQNAAPSPVADANAKARNSAMEAALQNAKLPAIGAKELSGITLESLLKSSGRPDATELAIWAAGLNAKDAQAAMTALQSLPAGSQRDTILDAVIGSWAKQDPKGFLASTAAVGSPRLREEGITEALRALAAKDPQAALAWFKENPGASYNNGMQNRYAAVMAGYAIADPKGAFDMVNAMSATTQADAMLKREAMQGLIRGLSETGNFNAAIEMFGQLPPGQDQSQALNLLMNEWARYSPKDAADWVATVTDPQMQRGYYQQIAREWAGSDPAAAALWAAQMDSQLLAATGGAPVQQQGFGGRGGAGRGNRGNATLLANTINSWSQMDLDGPADFLNKLPSGPEKEVAVASFVRNASSEDPNGAFQWLSTISNEDTKAQLTRQIAMQWRNSDPQAYQEFLGSANYLTDAQKEVLANLPQGGGGRGGGGNLGGGFNNPQFNGGGDVNSGNNFNNNTGGGFNQQPGGFTGGRRGGGRRGGGGRGGAGGGGGGGGDGG